MSSQATPLVLVPGFLGCAADWNEVAQFLPIQSTPLPLPSSPEELFHLTQNLPRFHLAGYSMGGRIALQFAALFPERVDKLILISSHLGLASETEKQKRLAHDEQLALLLLADFEKFLNMWYNQALFKPLARKRNIVKERQSIDPQRNAKILVEMSLGKQPNFWGQIPPSTSFILGELDETYRLLYRNLAHRLIPKAGHAVHLEEPEEAARVIWECLK